MTVLAILIGLILTGYLALRLFMFAGLWWCDYFAWQKQAGSPNRAQTSSLGI